MNKKIMRLARTGRGGRLGASATLSQSISVSKNGNIPLYVSLYSSQGSLLGWLTLTNETSHIKGEPQKMQIPGMSQ